MGTKAQSHGVDQTSKPVDSSQDFNLSEDEKPPHWGLALSSTPSYLRKAPQPYRCLLKTNVRKSFPISAKTHRFITKFYPQITPEQWNDWKWQLRNRVRTIEQIERFIALTESERQAFIHRKENFPVAITPYYLSLISKDNPLQPLRKTHVPRVDEFLTSPEEASDPLGEEKHTPVPGLVHRYPDRVLFLTTGFCATYCRYCTRSRMVGAAKGECAFSMAQWERAIGYIEANPQIRDCLLSGGDVLSIEDDKLDWLLSRLRAIKHLEFIRIGSKLPVVLPQRITKKLCAVLKKYHPLWMSIHFTHPDELTPETLEACRRLANAGIPLGSQTVLLKGINDDAVTLKALFHGLLKARVKPYYLYQCDPVSGSAHFRTTVDKGLELIKQLRGYTTGYAIPQYVIDAPGGGGKIPLLPDYVAGREGNDLLLLNYEGGLYRYPDPGGKTGRMQQQARRNNAIYEHSSGVYIL